MDSVAYRQIVNYKKTGEFPHGFSEDEKRNFRTEADTFDIEDGDLYYVRYKGTPGALNTKVVCDAEEANTIFLEFHASSIGGHCGQRETRDAISRRFYWPGMSSDIDKWVADCLLCQVRNLSIKQEVEYTPIVVTHPFELVGMDLIGKLSTTEKGHQYICVMVDYLTKWPQAYPLRAKSAKEVTDCILKFFYQFGAPKRILIDQEKEFVNEINKNVRCILGIKSSLCTPYHPQTNGLVERMNGTIQQALSKLVEQKPEQWDNHLDAVMFGLRTKKIITTQYSPFYLMFGREARDPNEVPEHNAMVVDAEVSEDMLHLDEVLKDGFTNSKAVQEKMQ